MFVIYNTQQKNRDTMFILKFMEYIGRGLIFIVCITFSALILYGGYLLIQFVIETNKSIDEWSESLSTKEGEEERKKLYIADCVKRLRYGQCVDIWEGNY